MEIIQVRPALMAELLPIVANPEACMNVRFGASAVFERFAGTPLLKDLVMRLGGLAADADARVRADASHYVGLSRSIEARNFLEARLGDESAEVRKIAAGSLAEIAEAKT